MEALHVLKEAVEGVATSRHQRDGFNLRAFASAVNLSDCESGLETRLQLASPRPY